MDNKPGIITLYELDKNYINNKVNNEKAFHIRTDNGVTIIEGKDLSEWIIKEHSKDELRKLVIMIKTIKKRNMPIRPFLKTISLGLTSKHSYILFCFFNETIRNI